MDGAGFKSGARLAGPVGTAGNRRRRCLGHSGTDSAGGFGTTRPVWTFDRPAVAQVAHLRLAELALFTRAILRMPDGEWVARG